MLYTSPWWQYWKRNMYWTCMEDVRLLIWYFSCSSQNKSKTPLSCTDLAGMGGIKRCPLENLDLLQKFTVKLPKVRSVPSFLQHNKIFLSPTLPPSSPVNTSLSVPCCMYIHVGTMMWRYGILLDTLYFLAILNQKVFMYCIFWWKN